jgi:hypothetical protein
MQPPDNHEVRIADSDQERAAGLASEGAPTHQLQRGGRILMVRASQHLSSGMADVCPDAVVDLRRAGAERPGDPGDWME